MRTLIKISLLVSILMVITLLPTSSKAEEKKWEEANHVAIDKTWTIQFNTRVESNSTNHSKVYVTGPDGSRLDNNIVIEGKTITIDAPQGNYKPESTYTIQINEGITSTSGVASTQSHTMNFTTKKATPYINNTFKTQLENKTLKGMKAGLGTSKEDVIEKEGTDYTSRDAGERTILSYSSEIEEDYSYTLQNNKVIGASLNVEEEKIHATDLEELLGAADGENTFDLGGHYTLTYLLPSNHLLVAVFQTSERSSTIQYLFIME
ncbi:MULTISPECIES: Ig-like domain-containing protein [Pontibacillus]|uniref:Ig-like domain-containing protein n=1 Tax=Pontibacillus chungwhensis TaxID=265426 RepID=A0ABY8UY66_9BACI|nr:MULTISPECIES: Ig-like domain-containing protein [Pontibacillus]MCD5324250.1 Ig-like domain-containing protein [Pontibacillus sp. HN14]WIF97696.1 Ig-like domain-containing protein [Pontibacillus chungwhensis]